MTLFRQEAIRFQRQGLTGQINLAQPLSITFTLVVLTTIASAIIIFLCQAKYTRVDELDGS
ncbi:MAG: hypothetical protein AAGB12_02575 [Pseudomonadota bacterium]